MNTQRSNPLHTTRYRRTNHKTQGFDEHYSRTSASIQSLRHNLASPIPLENPNSSHCIACIGKYLLLEQLDGEHVFRAANLHNGEELICKVFEITRYRESLVAYFSLSAHKNLNHIVEIILGDTGAYVFFETSYGDTYSFLRSCKRLNEDEAAKLFYQMASAVAHCHDNGLVLRDLKLRKFVFKNKERNLIKLESLEDAHILDGEDDSLSDKCGCPAYVSPEALNTSGRYSGKAADVWSLGVMLYRILVGRYPFQGAEPCSLFSKISQGQFCIPDTVTPKAKCLLCSILRQEPGERLTSREILDHPWFSTDVSEPRFGLGANNKETSDQMVPDMKIEEEL